MVRDKLRAFKFIAGKLKDELAEAEALPKRNINGFSNWERTKEIQRIKRNIKVNELNITKAELEERCNR